jgi:hypothetical protein
MVIENPFDNYVGLFRTFRMASADAFMVARHSRSPIARFTTAPKTAERRGALSKFQYHPLLSPGRCRSIRISRFGDHTLSGDRVPPPRVRRHLPRRGMSFALSLTHNST